MKQKDLSRLMSELAKKRWRKEKSEKTPAEFSAYFQRIGRLGGRPRKQRPT